MTTTIPSADLVVSVEPLFTEPSGSRWRVPGRLRWPDPRRVRAGSVDVHGLVPAARPAPFQARRADIEGFGRDMETRGRARAAIARRLCTIAGFYRYVVEEELLEHSPAVHVRRPKVNYDSHAIAPDRNEVGSLLVAAGLGAPHEHALISLLAINGLRISEALGADIDKLGFERRDRTLTVLRKGGKIVTIPLAPRTARAIDHAIGERLDGPIFLGPDGQRMDRHCASRIVRRVARRAGVDKPIGPHTLRHAFITAALDAAVPSRDVPEAASHALPEDDHALRPRPRLTRPTRHLHRRRLHCRRDPIGPGSPSGACTEHAARCQPKRMESPGMCSRSPLHDAHT
jgi:site-specific recombinase XerD